MKKILFLWSSFWVMFIAPFHLWADAAESNGNSNTSPVVPIVRICPPASALHKNPKTLMWSAKGGWKSYQKSLAEHIDGFVGAQWQGVAVGQVSCIYKPANSYAFQISLFFNTITLEPSGNLWTKNLGGYRNCVSANLADCPFILKPATQTQDP